MRVSLAAACPAYIPNVLVPKIRNPDITPAKQLLVERFHTAKIAFQKRLPESKLLTPRAPPVLLAFIHSVKLSFSALEK